jgi:hypothetical protein
MAPAELAVFDPPNGVLRDSLTMQVNTSVTSTIAANQLLSRFDALPHHTSDIIISKNPFLPGFRRFDQSISEVGKVERSWYLRIRDFG